MRRRTVLAAVAALAAGSGCSRLLGGQSVRVRVMRVPAERAADASRHCSFGAGFVGNHPVLERLLTSAASAPRGEWVTTDTDRDTGERLAADLRVHCEAVGGVYHYDGGNYAVEVLAGDDELFPGTAAGSEAIRGAPAETGA